MLQATLHLHPDFHVARVDDRIFGGFVEHLGRCIYEGLYDPENTQSDANGFRSDVQKALRGLELSIVRYPGGNFASGYHWQDGVGPRADRPTRKELAWRSLEPNTFGTDEFIAYCKSMNWQPMICANLGTGTPEEAMNWVEYCNSPPGSIYADLRADHGHREPHKVQVWCLGNEMDGPWQMGHVPVLEYASRARQAAKMMKACDPQIETVVCGSSSPQMPTFPDWDLTVLKELGDLADYISLHRYVGNSGEDAEYLAVGKSIDEQIESIDACTKVAAARARSPRRTHLCFDEWNVWYRNRGQEHTDGRDRIAPPLLEEHYTFIDALVVASFLMSFIRHADSVKIANLAQLVNVIAPVVTNHATVFKQTIFDPFEMVSTRKGGIALQGIVDCTSYVSQLYGEVSYLDYASILDGEVLKLFALNRHLTQSMEVHLDCHGFQIQRVDSAELLYHNVLDDCNSFDEPNKVRSCATNDWSLKRGITFELPPHSFLAATCKIA